jgi:hypothetical protein
MTNYNEHRSLLLRLPIELRREIYRYVLPYTYTEETRRRNLPTKVFVPWKEVGGASQTLSYPMNQALHSFQEGINVFWQRGCTRLLAINRQIHEECADMMYGDNLFVVYIAFDSIEFCYQFRTLAPSNRSLTLKGKKDFLYHFSQRNLLRIRNYVINVEHVDAYTGMIKYNCGGRGLTVGIRRQVQSLVGMLAVAPGLQRLYVHLIRARVRLIRLPEGEDADAKTNNSQPADLTQTVLDPFMRLYDVREAKVTGASPAYEKTLEQSMMASRESRGIREPRCSGLFRKSNQGPENDRKD